MHQHNRDHEIRAPSMQRSYEPTQSNSMVESLKAVPRLSRGWHIDQRKQNACHELEYETCQRSAAENIKPACGITWNQVLGRLANRCSKLQTQIEPVTHFLDQAHVGLPPALFATG